ncbi:transcriptional regulator [Roseomonas sp. BN140053]|uniref:transcriptional regulator n=1 Tax=Roseomonas sp. BN140053 TaxID=3391898 RepID=UPI0039E9E4BD
MATVFVDFEASSLGKHGFPVEVAWVFESGDGESHLIRPAPDWTEWAPEAEAIHRLSLATLRAEGEPHDAVARRMLDQLEGHDLYASAPSWDGQWLSRLLRAAGVPRHALRLRDTDEAQERAVAAALDAGGIPAEERAALAARILDAARHGDEAAGPPAHRALADARRELVLWQAVRRRAEDAARSWRAPAGPGARHP